MFLPCRGEFVWFITTHQTCTYVRMQQYCSADIQNGKCKWTVPMQIINKEILIFCYVCMSSFWWFSFLVWCAVYFYVKGWTSRCKHVPIYAVNLFKNYQTKSNKNTVWKFWVSQKTNYIKLYRWQKAFSRFWLLEASLPKILEEGRPWDAQALRESQ